VQDAGQNFDGGGFTGPVRTDETEQFAVSISNDRLRTASTGVVLRLEQGAHRSAQPGGFAFGLSMDVMGYCKIIGWSS
jgi:hypothetical protein